MFKKVFIIILFFSFISSSFAHPIDITKSTLGIKNNQINITTFFHSFEIDYLLKVNNIEVSSVEDYFYDKNKDIIKSYISKNIKLNNNGKSCKISEFNFFKDEIYNILTDGFKVNYKLICDEKINDFNLEVNFFVNFPLQTNRVKIYNLNNGIESILYKVLTPKINNILIDDLSNFKPKRVIDTDCEGLGDEDEFVYKTDPNKVDTDGDNYTDYEEITYGWDPLNSSLGPGQKFKNKLDKVVCKKEQIEANNDPILIKQLEESTRGKLDSSNYGMEYLKNLLRYINDYITLDKGNLLYIFIAVYILGIIHAAGPGHSKSLLIAYTLQKNTGYKKGLLYSFIFSVTHILDILLLFLITTVIFSYIDVSKYTYYIQLVSISILFLFSLYLIYKAFHFRKNIDKKVESKKTEKKTLLIAFLAGLAPCSFAWSIYFLLLSLGKLSFIIPLIIALGLGILTMLSLIVLITVFLKEKTLSKTKIFSDYANKISAVLILLISIILLVKILNI